MDGIYVALFIFFNFPTGTQSHIGGSDGFMSSSGLIATHTRYHAQGHFDM